MSTKLTSAPKIAHAEVAAQLDAASLGNGRGYVLGADELCEIGKIPRSTPIPKVPEHFSPEVLRQPHPLRPGETIGSSSVLAFDAVTFNWHLLETTPIPNSLKLDALSQDRLIAGIGAGSLILEPAPDVNVAQRIFELLISWQTLKGEPESSFPLYEIGARTGDLSGTTDRRAVIGFSHFDHTHIFDHLPSEEGSPVIGSLAASRRNLTRTSESPVRHTPA